MELRNAPQVPHTHFCSSTCLDLVCSAHILLDSSHHGFASEWTTTAARLVDIKTSTLDTLRELPLKGLELCNASSLAGDLDDVEGFVDCLKSMSRVEFAYWLLQEKYPLPLLRNLIEGQHPVEKCLPAPRPGSLSRQWVGLLVKDVARYQDAVCETLEKVTPFTLETVQSLSSFYESAAQSIAQAIVSAGKPLAQIAVDLAGEGTGNCGGEEVRCFIVSWFASPHRLRWCDLHRDFLVPDWQEMMVGLESGRAHDLKKVVGALADANRLIIMRELARARAPRRALAPKVGLTPATMSHHLDVLVSAGLVTREEVGSAQYYSTDLSAVDAAVKEIQDYLRYNPKKS